MDSTRCTNEIKARKFIDKHATEAVEMVVFASSKVLTPLLYCISPLNNGAHAFPKCKNVVIINIVLFVKVFF